DGEGRASGDGDADENVAAAGRHARSAPPQSPRVKGITSPGGGREGTTTHALARSHLIVFSASLSRATTDISRCSSLVSSILLCEMPWRLCTKSITVGTPARATSAASCSGPLGRRCDTPAVSLT